MTQALAEELSDQFNDFILSQVGEDVQILYFPGRFHAETLRKPANPAREPRTVPLFTYKSLS